MPVPSKQEIRLVIDEPQQVDLMIDATKRGRPAVEPLEPKLTTHYKKFLKTCTPEEKKTFKRMVGLVAKEIIERKGCEVKRKGVQVKGKRGFCNVAAVYKRR